MILSRYIRHCLAAALALLAVAAFTSCDDRVYDDQGDCDPHYRVRFRYDMNMKYADAFPSTVESVTLYVVNKYGKVVRSLHENDRDKLRTEGYCMDLDSLEPGTYTLLAWAGLGHKTHFTVPGHESTPGEHISTVTATLNRRYSYDGSAYIDEDLDGLYHGILELQEFPDAEGTHIFTVPLVKNTNDFHVVLQHLSGEPVDHSKFTFSIADCNGTMAHDNTLMADEDLTYKAWSVKSANAGVDMGGRAITQVSAAVADLTTARLVNGQKTRLNVRNQDGENIISIPLIDYCLMVKGRYEKTMTDQEYLDRQDDYSMVFFLDDNDRWINTSIFINSWHVVLQDASAR